MSHSICLSINVNKVATLRNSRGKNLPDVVRTALDLVEMGAHGITVHPRPDGRHIRRQDVYDLKEVLKVELNVEGYPSSDFLQMIEEVRPAQVTLVPDPPEALTSNAGWVTRGTESILRPALERITRVGARSSVFVDPETAGLEDLRTFKAWGADRIELYTEQYAEDFGTDLQTKTLGNYQQAARSARQVGLGVNAGHDLNLRNLATFSKGIPELLEVSIGHAFICDSLYLGYHESLNRYLKALAQ